MNLKQLEALVTIADTGSVTRAAQLLHLVQPAVTRQIRSLEEELNVELFDRTRHGMLPTAAGASLVDRARRILHEVERARTEIRAEPMVVTGIVTVGILESLVDLLTRPLLIEIAERYPGIKLRILTGYSGHLQKWLDAGDADMALLYNVSGAQSLNVVPLVKESIWAVAPLADGLDPAQPVPLHEFMNRRLVVPMSGHGVRIMLDRSAAENGIDPDYSVETNSLKVQKQLVEAGFGWTAMPASGIAGDVPNGRLSAAPIGDPEITRTIVLGLQRAGSTSPAVEAVGRALISLVRSQARSDVWPSAWPSDRPS